MAQPDLANRPRLVYKESLILGVGIGLFVQESVGAGETGPLPALAQPVELLAASDVDAPSCEVRESLIAGVGQALFAVAALVVGDVVSGKRVRKAADVKKAGKRTLDVKPEGHKPTPRAAKAAKRKAQPTVQIDSEPAASAPVTINASAAPPPQRRLLTLDDTEQRRRHGTPTIVVRESLIAGVGCGAFAADDFELGDVLGALDEAEEPRNEPFNTLFATATAPSDAHVLGNWTQLTSASQMQAAYRAMRRRSDVPNTGWLRLTKKQLLWLLENDADDTVLNVPLSIKSLAPRVDSERDV
ncbi:hypothetical protein SPRG_16966 [Saprolegnia parasitica CBS 223.65]|uniref:Uncharacterized protein n=1 Tax=Saprolegnia parasitica (strain CBS 223.65) TaxID=695850 RepID=A0A067BGV9_SAPPC|nr:hypothetical protein SPRG_16966 [Saprolegnia parasitica CBS 223.65]KDO17629.1 hypothetical protein SPRG_16966 [Saprolegnia parasitica CBS 223.65]|eukprot:XP_012211663.1 hypothetical protein SPRG_16966 [Saprolegnia parasitica CBS 223.65]